MLQDKNENLKNTVNLNVKTVNKQAWAPKGRKGGSMKIKRTAQKCTWPVSHIREADWSQDAQLDT